LLRKTGRVLKSQLEPERSISAHLSSQIRSKLTMRVEKLRWKWKICKIKPSQTLL